MYQRQGSSYSYIFHSMPVTVSIIALWIVVFFAQFVAPVIPALLVLNPNYPPTLPTAIFTYALVAGSPITLLFAGWAFYLFGGSVERAWGSRNFLFFLLAVNFATALVYELGAFLLAGQLGIMADPWYMVAAVIVAWAWMNQEETVQFMFVLPMKAKWLGWLSVGLLFFLAAPVGGRLLLIGGFFALGGVGLTAAYMWYRKKWAWIPRRPPENKKRVLRHPAANPFGFITRPFREWQRKRRVAHLQKTIRFHDE